MTFPIKLGISSVALGSLTAIGYASSAYFMNNKKEVNSVTEQQLTTISALIDKEYKHILLKTSGEEDKDHWVTNWNSYKKANQKLDTDIFELAGWKKDNPDDLTDKLKEKCGKLIIENVLDNSNTTYQNVIKYCAREVTIADQASKEQLTIISTKNNDNAWNKIAGNKSSLTEHFDKLGITASNKREIVANDIKDGCEKIVAKKKSESNYQNTYESYKEVCTDKGSR